MPRRGLDTDGLSLRAQPCRRRGEHYFACVVGQRLGLWLVNPYRVGHDLVYQFRGSRSHCGPAVDELPLADTGAATWVAQCTCRQRVVGLDD